MFALSRAGRVEEIDHFSIDIPESFSSAASKTDGIVVINRTKPHSDFWNLRSGIQKMLAISVGEHGGAINAHKAASRLGHQVP